MISALNWLAMLVQNQEVLHVGPRLSCHLVLPTCQLRSWPVCSSLVAAAQGCGNGLRLLQDKAAFDWSILQAAASRPTARQLLRSRLALL